MKTFSNCPFNDKKSMAASGRNKKSSQSSAAKPGPRNNVQTQKKTFQNPVKITNSPIHNKNNCLNDVWRPNSNSLTALCDIKDMCRITVIAGIAILTFAKTLHGSFVFDDSEAILNNPDVRPLDPKGSFKGSLWSVFLNDFWGYPIRSQSSHKSYRPLTVLTFRLQAWLDPSLAPLPFHAINICLHGLVSVLCYFLFGKILRNFSVCSGDSSIKFTKNTQFLAAAIFAIHPIHCETVASVVGRAELLSAVLYLASVLQFIKYFEKDVASYAIFALAMCFAFLAMLAKEQGVTALGVAICYIAIQNKFWHQLQANVEYSTCRSVTVLITAAGSIVLFRLWVMSFQGPRFSALDNPASFLDSWIFRTLNYQYLWCLNALLLVWPHWLCFDWSMGCVPLIQHLSDLRLGAVVVLWLGFGAFVLMLTKTEDNTKQLHTFCLALLLVPFLPASNVLFPVGFVIAERVLYLPSIGGCLLATYWLTRALASDWVASRSGYKMLLSSAIVVGFSLLSIKSNQRSEDWLSEESLYRSGLAVCPGNAKIRYNLGKVLADAGMREEALGHYWGALNLQPDYEQALNNLANLLKDQRKYHQAEKLLAKAVQLRPDFATAWMNLGIVRAALNSSQSAELCYWNSLSIRPDYADAWFNLGNLMLEEGRFSEAQSAWRNATWLKPTHAKAWTNLIILLDDSGDPGAAELLALEAIGSAGGNAGIHYALANILARQNRYKEAELNYATAIWVDPEHVGAHANLGVLYHRIKLYKRAKEAYSTALRLNPGLVKTRRDLESLLEQWTFASK